MNSSVCWLSSTALSAIVFLTMTVATESEAAFSDFLWKNRPLVIFAPDTNHPDLAAQRRIVETARSGFRARDMVVIVVAGNDVSLLVGTGRPGSAAALRRRFAVSAESFSVILVGKDGGVKRRAARPVGSGSLFQQIDAMPMRRQEMRRRGE